MAGPDHIDTIAALATAPGPGGIAVIRVSGPEACHLGKQVFSPSSTSFSGFDPHRLHHGRVLDTSGAAIDEVLAVLMPGPRSYTGEDTLEIHCHGGPAIVRAVLDTLFALGARQARAGEFTLRAFLNGRIDLTQAEAVSELISAPCRASADLARLKLEGALGGRIRGLAADLLGLKAQLCLAVDFPEDEVECLPPEDLAKACAKALDSIRAMLEAVRRARPWRDGALAVLAGPVNAGKSSLLNALAGKRRALVAPTPGTTRDCIEETLDFSGLPVRVADTAGLRDAPDDLERLGIEISLEMVREADLVVLVLDAGKPLMQEDLAWLDRLSGKPVLAALNKADLGRAEPDPAQALAVRGLPVVEVSALTGLGVDGLARAMRRALTSENKEPDPDTAAPNARQAQALAQAAGELEALMDEAGQGAPYDCLGARMDTACALLAELTGEVAAQDVLDHIFSTFCIGK